MKRFLSFMLVAATLLAAACGSKYSYERVKGDPLETRIYTLDNGLKVYMTVNDEAPRIQTFIAVKVGSKNDPIETTGLAHYFEHLMFKGTESFGTQDYAAEKPMLDEIERLFEVYRKTTDPIERTALYARIDSVSQEASKLAIPNEYDKLMAAIGAQGTNAFTSTDMTVYVEDIPSNQIENWARIQADRFKHAVIRGFHTELETVYEEYNMSLTNDTEKTYDALMECLFPKHPYGQHTVLGFPEHLKNPSITNIKNYYKTYYVPNNMAICLSGDFDPEQMIATIDACFGDMEPNENLPRIAPEPEAPITSPVEREVYGQETAFLYMGWPTATGASGEDAAMAEIVASLLSNGKCGLIDVDLKQKQKVLDAGAGDLMMADRGALIMVAYPREGQSLEEVRDLLLDEVAKLRAGDFDQSLLGSTIANLKLRQMAALEENWGRAMSYVNSYIMGIEWKDEVEKLDRLSRITKEEVVAWAERTLGGENYVAIYKRQGEDKDQKKIDKPRITPIAINRDEVSDFLAEIRDMQVEPIEPRFVDFDKDMEIGQMKGGIEVLHKRNRTNDIFTLYYLYDMGVYDDPMLGIAASEYFPLLGTADRSLEQIQRAFYDLACTFRIVATNDRTYVMISGLSENMEEAIALAEDYMQHVEGDDAVLAELKADIFKSRADNKFDQSANYSALSSYAIYGPEAIKARTLGNDRLQSLTSDELIGRIRSLADYDHRVLYYGPLDSRKLVKVLDANHRVSDDPIVVDKVKYPMQPTPQNRVLLAQYDAKQIYYMQFSNRGDRFSPENDPIIRLYNAYFGDGMSAIVFQEMREARALAYSAWANLGEGRDKDDPYAFRAFIATQNDKMQTAIETFEQIIENMPESQAAFDLAKQQLLAALETHRTTKSNVLWSYIDNCEMGVDYDRNKAVYEKLKDLTFDDVKRFHKEWIKDRSYVYMILGDKNDIDVDFLRTIGPLKEVSQEEIFGY